MRPRYSLFVSFLLVLAVPPAAQADAVDDAVQLELSALAKQIDPVLQKQKARVVHVGAFQGPGTTSTGPEIQTKLSDALKKMDYTIDSFDYDVEVRGRYQQFDGPRGLLGAEIVVQLFNSQGRPILELTGAADEPAEIKRPLFGSEAVPRMLGIAFSLPPGLGEPDRSKELKKQQDTPPTDIRGHRIYAAPDSPYAIEILIKNGSTYQFRDLETKGRKEFPFVPIDKQEVYAVRLINESAHDAAVNLTIDGISVFQFSESHPKPGFWIVPAGSQSKPGTTLVRGWDKNEHKTIEFKVTDFPETAAARLKIQPNTKIGQITAQFSAAWKEDEAKPADEPTTRGTGFGDEIEDNKKTVRRHVGNVRATIIVRYER